jgi:Icc protein
MLIAQISDVHLGFDPDDPDELNLRRFDQLLAHLARLDMRPDALLVTGDLTDRGDAGSYARLAERLGHLRMPVHLAIGNHDRRAGFRAAFPATPTAYGFVQYAINTGALRILVLDTHEEGRHGGGFCGVRAAWLGERLAEAPDRPTLIALHHPPIETGLWMTTDDRAPWLARLAGAIAGHRNVVALVGGHIHRPIAGTWRGVPVLVCPSVAPAVALTLAPIDPDAPDDRPMVTAAPPGFALHLWRGGRLTTHFDTAETHPALARFDPRMQPLLAHLRDEQPG